uniref:Uncharacterized protein n=1 Tax=Hucho hucho TaxID=62062 RepID=A0A4W5NSW1_9TELE
MHQTDMLRRRQVMAQIPAQNFQPLYKRQEMREDWQRDMEFTFEDMYTGERRVKGDLVLQLVPEPLLVVSTGSQDEDLDLTLEEATPDLTPLAGAEEQQDEGEAMDDNLMLNSGFDCLNYCMTIVVSKKVVQTVINGVGSCKQLFCLSW